MMVKKYLLLKITGFLKKNWYQEFKNRVKTQITVLFNFFLVIGASILTQRLAFMNIAPGRTSSPRSASRWAEPERELSVRSAHAQRTDGRGTSVALCARPTLNGTTSVEPTLLWTWARAPDCHHCSKVIFHKATGVFQWCIPTASCSILTSFHHRKYILLKI